MPDTAQPVLRFHSDALPSDDLIVTRLEGAEWISRPYRFEVELVSRSPDFAIGPILRKPAWVGIEQGILSPQGELVLDLPLRIHGRIPSFEQVEKRDDVIFYKATLVPRLWKLSLTYQSRIFLGKTVPEILEAVLQGTGLAKEDYEFKLTKEGGYAVRDYVVQYEESDLDFLSRWLEHEGIFYFFRQADDRETVVFADSVNSYAPFRGNDSVRFLPDPGRVAGAEVEKTWFREESVQTLSCRHETIPQKVILKDYNWRKPSLDLKCSVDVDPEGEGTVYEYNNHFKTPEEGTALARVRAEEIRCRRIAFRGSSDCRAFRTGATWRLTEHFRNEFNAPYLITEVRHLATQPAQVSTLRETRATYTNDFVCIPAGQVFRPPRVTPWPAIRGAMHAKIDGAADGTYAEIDEEGQYKVKLPLDLSQSTGGQASRYVRMAQPYAGADHGMHFPLHKGTEVLLTHIDGDPDRPIITGAVPNSESSSIVHGNNHTRAGIQTAAGNQIAIEDAAGHERILLKSGSGKSHLVVGSGSVDRADLTSVFTSGWGHAGYMFGSTGWTTGLGAMKVDFTAGYPLMQAAVGMVKLACEAGGALLGKQARESDLPAAAAMIVPPLVGLGGTIVLKMLFSKLVKSKIQAAVVKKVTTLPEDNTPWYKIHQHVYKGIKNQWDYMMGVSSTGLGAYLIRGEGGSRMQLTRGGESILIGTDKGQLILYGGQNVWITSPEGVLMNADFFLNLYTKKGSISLTELGLALNFAKHAFLLEEEKVTLQSSQKILLGAGKGEVGTKGAGKEAYVRILDDGVLQEVRVSAREQIELHTSTGTVKCAKDHIELAFGDDAKVTLKDGEIEIKAKKVSLVADDVLLGDANKSDVLVAGTSIAISSEGAASIKGQGGVTVNTQRFAP